MPAREQLRTAVIGRLKLTPSELFSIMNILNNLLDVMQCSVVLMCLIKADKLLAIQEGQNSENANACPDLPEVL